MLKNDLRFNAIFSIRSGVACFDALRSIRTSLHVKRIARGINRQARTRVIHEMFGLNPLGRKKILRQAQDEC